MAQRELKSALSVAIGDRLRQIRRLRGADQTEVARAMGITQSSVSNYEHGLRDIHVVSLLRALDYLGCRPAEFFVALDAFIVPLSRDQERVTSLRDANGS